MEASALVVSIGTKLSQINGFFTEFDDKQECCKCSRKYYFMRQTTTKRLWCIQCYINNYCDVFYRGDGMMIINRISHQIMYNSITEDIKDINLQPPIDENSVEC